MKWNTSIWTKARQIELAASLAGLAGALALNNHMGRIANRLGDQAHPSPDVILSLLPLVDLRFVFIWGFVAFIAWAVAAAIWREGHRVAHIVWLYTLLIALRSLFLVLTPMRTPDGGLWVAGDPFFDAIGRHLTFKHDLFFSSHTALPFLGYLVYRDTWIRRSFLVMSVLMAATVLLTRMHYSIDVFSAYFITYAVYRFERRRLRRPYRMARHWLLGWLQTGSTGGAAR